MIEYQMRLFWASLIILAATCLILRDTSLAFLTLWNENVSYSHGLPTLAVIIYLLYDNVRKASPPLFQISRRAAGAAIIIAIGGWFAAEVTGIQVVTMAMLPIVALLLIRLSLGDRALTYAWFPIALTLFTMPVWEALHPALQAGTTAVVEQVLSLLRIPVHITGNFVSIPAGTFEIASGCSGLRYLMATLEFAAIYAYWWLPTWTQRLMLFISATFFALLTNWVRVSIIIKIGQDTNLQSPLVKDHNSLGLWLYFAAMVLVFFVAQKIRGKNPNSKSASVSKTMDFNDAVNWRRVGAGIFLLAMVGLVEPAIAYRTDPFRSYHLAPAPIASDWAIPTSVKTDQLPWEPVHEHAAVDAVLYQQSNRQMWYYRALYPWQRQGQELVNFDNRLFNPSIAKKILRQGLTTQHGQPMGMLEMMRTGNRTGLLVYWYKVAGFSTDSESVARLYLLPGLLKARKDGQVSMLYSECLDDCGAVKLELLRFAERFYSQ